MQTLQPGWGIQATCLETPNPNLDPRVPPAGSPGGVKKGASKLNYLCFAMTKHCIPSLVVKDALADSARWRVGPNFPPTRLLPILLPTRLLPIGRIELVKDALSWCGRMW